MLAVDGSRKRRTSSNPSQAGFYRWWRTVRFARRMGTLIPTDVVRYFRANLPLPVASARPATDGRG